MGKRKIAIIIFLVIVILLLSFSFSIITYNLLNNTINTFNDLLRINLNLKILIYTLLYFFILSIVFLFIYLFRDTSYNINNIKITDNISIPKPFKNTQYGNAHFFNNKKIKSTFPSINIYNNLTDERNKKIENAGIIINFKKNKNKEEICYINDDVHSIILGGSRSGKTRCFCLQLLSLLIMANENFIANDIKQELLLSCIDLMKYYNYKTIIFNFCELEKSNHYNFLESIIQHVNNGDIEIAENEIWDLATILSTNDNSYQKGEQFWQDGQISLIATAIMIVVYENKGKYEYQNLGNVYNFISIMCAVDINTGEEPIIRYIDNRYNDTSSIKQAFSVVRTAPPKTRLSFYTSALASLRLFSNKLVCSMTSKTDIDFTNIDKEKVGIFLISSAEKDTYNKLVALIISQLYSTLAEKADINGGQLEKRFNFVLDEFANIKINNFSEILTVAGGRKIRFYLFLQSLSQLNTNYNRDYAKTIIDNCKILVYLNSSSIETLTEIEKRLGTYTTAINSNSSNAKNSTSQSISLISRSLLKVEELARLKRPYTLIIYSGESPIITKIPDLSCWNFNNFLGLGNKEHNNKIRNFRLSQLPKINLKSNFKYWEIEKGGKKSEKENK